MVLLGRFWGHNKWNIAEKATVIAWHSMFLTACISETGAHDHHAAVLQKSLVKILKPVHGETLVKKDPLQENNTSPFVMTIVCQPFIYDTLSSHHLSWLNYSPTHLYVNNSWNTGIAKIERHTTPSDICWDICQICGKHGESEAITVHPIERTLQTRCHRSQACNGLHGNQ